MNSIDPAILDFWNQRALLGRTAGTNDVVLTEIEQQFLVSSVPQGARILDIGCGNGGSLIRLAKEKDVRGTGFDFSENMVVTARKAIAEAGFEDRLSIHQGGVPPIPTKFGKFPIAYSQRCLINLRTSDEQREAVLSVADVLDPGGTYIMIECFNEGAANTNHLRRMIGLEPMPAPWHNRFLNLHEVKEWSTPNFFVDRVIHISSTYHLLSRVVYAKLAEKTGEELQYESDINLIAAQLPQEIGEFGPVKACIWKKAR